MKIFSNDEKKYSISNIVFLTIAFAMVIFSIIMVEEAIRCFIVKDQSIFIVNYVKNLIYLIITSFIFYIFYLLQNKKSLECNEIIKIFIILYVFLTFNLFNILNLYRFKYIKYAVFFITGILFSIFGVSIYYNYLKNENNKVKAKSQMVVIFSFAITIALGVFAQIFIYLINIISSSPIQEFKFIIYDMLFLMAGSLIMNILFYLSLLKTKKWINFCLIDIKKI